MVSNNSGSNPFVAVSPLLADHDPNTSFGGSSSTFITAYHNIYPEPKQYAAVKSSAPTGKLISKLILKFVLIQMAS